jgi:hypothetical protein
MSRHAKKRLNIKRTIIDEHRRILYNHFEIMEQMVGSKLLVTG